MITLYTAVGLLKTNSDSRGRYPQIVINGKEHNVDIGEMLIWSSLNWRILPLHQIEKLFQNGVSGADVELSKPFDSYVDRLISRGLIVSGSGDTDADALYDLVSDLYIIPTESSTPTKVLSFLKVVFIDRVPLKSAKWIFNRGKFSENEQRIIDVTKQAMLSTAEVIKCVENGNFDLSTEEKVLSALYDDDITTCDNIGSFAKLFKTQKSVLSAVANLYLRKQIIFQRI